MNPEQIINENNLLIRDIKNTVDKMSCQVERMQDAQYQLLKALCYGLDVIFGKEERNE